FHERLNALRQEDAPMLVANLSGRRSIAIVVQGLFEKSDSTGFDAVYQYDLLRCHYPNSDIALFAETFDKQVHPDLDINPIATLKEWLESRPDAILLYHFCDGWEDFETFFVAYGGRRIVRWHNNTPPWFYADNRRLISRTVNGFKAIIELIQHGGIEVWI